MTEPKRNRNRTTRCRLPGSKPKRFKWWAEHRTEVIRGLGLALLMGAIWLVLSPWHRTFEVPDVGSVAQMSVRARSTIEIVVPNADYSRALSEARAQARPVYAWDREAATVFAQSHRGLLEDLRRQRTSRKAEEEAIRSRALEQEALLKKQISALPADSPGRVELQARLDAVSERRKRDLEALAKEAQRRRKESSRKAAGVYGMAPDTAATFVELVEAAGTPTVVDVVVEHAVSPSLRRPIVRGVAAFQQALRSGVTVRTPDGGVQVWAAGALLPYAEAPWQAVTDLEAARRDARARADQAMLSSEVFEDPALQGAVLRAVASSVRSTLALDLEATRGAAEEQVAQVPRTVRRVYHRGEVIVEGGYVIDRVAQAALLAERANRQIQDSYWPRLGVLLLVLVLGGIVLAVHANLDMPARRPRPVLLLWCTALLLAAAIPRLWVVLTELAADRLLDIAPETVAASVPVAWAPMLVALFVRPAWAVALAVAAAATLGIMVVSTMPVGILAPSSAVLILLSSLSGSLVGLLAVRRVRQRNHLLLSGLVVCLVQAVVVAAGALAAEQQGVGYTPYFALGAFLSGVLSYLLLTALVAPFEWVFRLPTDLKLLELCDMNHPLLRQLSLAAPGSYHHSLRVAELAERAAEAIGAHSLLCRVGAYYHDIGKSKSPAYFAENQEPKRNPHDDLQPSMSALVLRAHVKDGIEMARRAGLPEDVIDFIPEHHGTALMTYFHHRAEEQSQGSAKGSAADKNGHPRAVVEMDDYRHIGPRPQRRETAIVMLADAVEAATRALADPSAPRVRERVSDIIREKFLDGQLDECDLTLRDLHAISHAFVSVLRSMHHQRPVYPSSPVTERIKSNTTTDLRLTPRHVEPLPKQAGGQKKS